MADRLAPWRQRVTGCLANTFPYSSGTAGSAVQFNCSVFATPARTHLDFSLLVKAGMTDTLLQVRHEKREPCPKVCCRRYRRRSCFIRYRTRVFHWQSGRSFEERHARFMRAQKVAYDHIAEKILAQRNFLTDQPRDLGNMVPPPFTASARTNDDGSVTIVFAGGEGGPRHGYIYHSGALLTKKPGDPEAYFYDLTNGWYEY